MSDRIGWNFPPNGGGVDSGFNHSGIEYYSGNPEYHLAREIIQNSLDARDNLDQPVIVRFEAFDVAREDFPGQNELLASFRACEKEEADNSKAEKFFAEGIAILQRSTISCLRISDSNTTGLRGKEERNGQWHNLTKAIGRSGSDKSDTAGGSYGIGKNAPFTMSSLRTVFYSTSYEEEGGFYYCAQGKSILTSHKAEETKGCELSQADGFYGVVAGCRPIVGRHRAPKFLWRENENGTTLIVSGFPKENRWEDKIIVAVAANFFCAIIDKNLEVHVGDRIINAEALDGIFGDESLWESIGETPMEFSRAYYKAMREGEFEEAQHPSLGHVKLWVLLVGDGLPKRTAIVRDTGMIITDRQPKFNFRGFNDYAALCICEGQEANKTLRGMENPAHDRFEPDRLKADKPSGVKILTDLRNWVRGKLSEFAMPQATEETALPELAEMFPDPDVIDQLPGENDERDIEGQQKIVARPQPVRRKPIDITLPEEDEGDDPEFPSEVREGGANPKQRKKGKPRGRFEIQDPRVIPDPNNPRKKTVKFTPMTSGEARLEISIAGDSFSEFVKTVDLGILRANERRSIDVTFERPMPSAFIVSVFHKGDES